MAVVTEVFEGQFNISEQGVQTLTDLLTKLDEVAKRVSGSLSKITTKIPKIDTTSIDNITASTGKVTKAVEESSREVSQAIQNGPIDKINRLVASSNIANQSLSSSFQQVRSVVNAIGDTSGPTDLASRIQLVTDSVSPLINTFDNVRSGIALATRDGGSLFLGLRQAVFGVSSSSNIAAKALDFLGGVTLKTSKATDTLAINAERISKQLGEFNQSISLSTIALKEIGKEEGINVNALSKLDVSVQKTSNEFIKLNDTIRATGELTPRQLAQVSNRTDLLLLQVKDLMNSGFVPLGTKSREVLDSLKDRLEDNASAAKIMTAQFNATSKSTENIKKVSGIFKGVETSVKSVARSVLNLNVAFKSVSVFKDVLLGALFGTVGGNVLSDLIFSVTNAIRQIPGALITAASDAEEMQNRFNAVFASMSDEGEVFAANLSRSIGRSINEIKQSVTEFQSFFIGLGFGGEQAFGFSTNIEKLALDFASFNNIADEEAVGRFISAMSGSSEVLDRFGINIKESATLLEAQRLGLAKSSEDFTEQEKVIARLSIIYKSMSDQGALGDAARTSLSFANQLKTLQGSAKDLTTTLGQQLLPAIAPFLRILNQIVLQIGPALLMSFSSLSATITKFATDVADTVQSTLSGFVNFDSSVSLLVASAVALFSGDWFTAWQLFVLAISDSINLAIDQLAEFVSSGFDWGFSFVEQIADGAIVAAKRLLFLAMKTIGDIISSFLQPGSPPDKGALSTINKWGSGLMDTFTEGMAKVDTNGLEQGLGQIKSVFDKFDPVSAQNDVLAIQEQIRQAEEQGFVPAHLKQALRLAQDKADLINQQQQLQSQLNKEKEKEPIDRGKSEVSANKGGGGIDGGAHGKIATEKKTALQIKNESLSILDQQLKDGVIKYEDYAKDRLRIEQKFYEDTLQEGGKVSQDNINNIKFYQDELDKIAEANKKTKGGVSSGIPTLTFEDIVGPGGITEDIQKGGFKIGKTISEAIKDGVDQNFDEVTKTIDQKINGIRTKLTDQFNSISDNVKSGLNELILPISAFGNRLGDNIVGLVQGVSFAATALLLLFRKISITQAIFGDIPKIFTFLVNSLQRFDIVVKIVVNTLDFLEKATKFIRPLFSFLNKIFTQIIGKVNPLTLLITAAVIGVIENIGLLTRIFNDLSKRYTDAFTGIIDGVFKIADLFSGDSKGFGIINIVVAGAMILFRELGDIISSVNPTIKGIFAGIFQLLSGIEKITIVPIFEAIGAVLNLLAGDTEAFSQAMFRIFDSAKSGTIDILSGLADIAVAAFTSLPNVVSEVLQSILTLVGLGFIGDAIQGYFNSIFGQISDGVNTVKDVVVSLLTGDLSIQSLFESLGLGPLALFLNTTLSGAIARLGETFGRLSLVLSTQLGPAFSRLFSTISVIVSGAIEVISERMQSLQPLFDAIGLLLAKFGFTGESSFNLLQGIVVGAVGAIIVIITVLAGIITGLVNGITLAIEAIIIGFELMAAGVNNVINGTIATLTGFSIFFTQLFQGNFAAAFEGLKLAFFGMLTSIGGVFQIMIGLVTVSLGSIIGLLAGFVEGVIGFFTNLYNELVGESIIPDMVTAILVAITGMVVDILVSLAQFVVDAIDQFEEMADEWVEAGKNIILGILNGINKNKDKVLEVLKSLIGDAVDGITSFLGIKSPSILFRDMGINIIEGLNEGINATVPSFIDAIGSAADDAEKILDEMLPQEKASAVLKSLKAVYRANFDEINALGRGGSGVLFDKLLKAVDLSALGVGSDAYGIIQHAGQILINQTYAYGEQQSEAFLSGQTNLFKNIQKSAADALEPFNQQFFNIQQGATQARIDLEKLFNRTVTNDEVENLGKALEGIPIEKLNDQQRLIYRNYILQKKLAGAAEQEAKVREAILKLGEKGQVFQSILEKMGLAEAPGAAQDTGNQITEALGLGIDAGLEEVLASLGGVSDSIIDKIKTALGIASPSTVFVGFGENLMGGLREGILSGIANVDSAIKSVNEVLVSGIDLKALTDIPDLKIGAAALSAPIKVAAGGNDGRPIQLTQHNTIGDEFDMAVFTARTQQAVVEILRSGR